MSPSRRELVKTTRNRIIDAAARLMHERGPDGFSMDALAKEAGVARATVYEHFRSKRALIDELAARTARTLTLDNHPTHIGNPLTALRDTIAAVCRHWGDHQETVREVRSLVAITGSEPPIGGLDEDYLRRLVVAMAADGQLRSRWSLDEAVDALAVLTSYPTFERLRRADTRTPAEVETLLAKIAVVIIAPKTAPVPQTP